MRVLTGVHFIPRCKRTGRLLLLLIGSRNAAGQEKGHGSMGCSIWPLDQAARFSHHIHVEPIEEPESVAAPSGKHSAIKYNARVRG